MAASIHNQGIHGQAPIVDWDPEPTKEVVKEAYGIGVSALVNVVKVPVKAITATLYGPVNDVAIDTAAEKVKEVAQVGTDCVADAAYATPTSLGSRVARFYGYPG